MTDRSTYIGSTEVVALVEPEASPFCSEYSIWCDKAGLVERSEPTERMNVGKYLEKAVLGEWNVRNWRSFEFNRETFFHSEGIGATPDGVDWPKEEGAEVKTVTRERRADWHNGTPRYIWWQAQHEMLCAKLSRVVVIAQFGFEELSHEWIEADPAAHERIISACDTMWKRINGALPPPDADGHRATTNALKKRSVEAKAIELSHDAREWSDELGMLERQIGTLSDEAQSLKNKIRAAMGDASTGVFGDGSGWRVQTINRKETVTKASSYSAMKRIKSKEAVEDELE